MPPKENESKETSSIEAEKKETFLRKIWASFRALVYIPAAVIVPRSLDVCIQKLPSKIRQLGVHVYQLEPTQHLEDIQNSFVLGEGKCHLFYRGIDRERQRLLYHDRRKLTLAQT